MSKRNAFISELKETCRYYEISTPINRGRLGYHTALLDCNKQAIIEGTCDDNGKLSVSEFALISGNLSDYITDREEILGFKFSKEKDICVTGVDTKETFKKHEQLIGKYAALAFLGKIFYKQFYRQLIDALPSEELLEYFWREAEQLHKEYDFSGEKGWNCESLVSYICTGSPDSTQGKFWKFLKKFGLNKEGRLFGMRSGSSRSKSSRARS